MRLQEREKEVDNLTTQLQAEKVVSFFCFLLSTPPSSSVEPQIVQNKGLYSDDYFSRGLRTGLLVSLDRQLRIPTQLWALHSAIKSPVTKMNR